MFVGWLVLLQVGLRMGQVAGSSWISAADGTLLEVALEDVTSGEGVAAQNAHVRAVSGVFEKKLALKMSKHCILLSLRLRRWRFKCFA